MKILFITLEQSGRQIVKTILEDNFFKINKNQIFTFGMDGSIETAQRLFGLPVEARDQYHGNQPSAGCCMGAWLI